MRAFVTGATGFIGGRLAARLRERGDDVVALVRSPSKAAALRDLGCVLIEGDLSDAAALARGIAGCDAVFHAAAVYKVGIPDSERPTMYDANVEGTRRVLAAAVDAGVKRIVYVSTVGAFGNTEGRVVDETYEREPDNFLSYYDETKFLSHEIAREFIADGAPVVIAQPGGVYGPGDHSDLGNLIRQIRAGRLKLMIFPELGFNLAHVDDIVDGIMLVHDKGTIGGSYVLGGEISTMGEFVAKVAPLLGRKPPRWALPPRLLKMAAPFGGPIAKATGLQPNLRESIAAAEGVTYWATDAKARRELGYSPRGLDAGLRDLVADLR